MNNTELIKQLQSLRPAAGVSIFSKISLKGRAAPMRTQTRALDFGEKFLREQTQDDMQTALEADVSRMASAGLSDDDHTVFFLCQKYSWRQPDPENADNGASWFDRRRVDKALAACNSPGYLLIKGDLTGIQDFIYADINLDIVGGAKNIAKRLRGKSFFVGILTDILAEDLLETLGLPAWNLLFAGGGHFNLLAPDNQDTRERLAKWKSATHRYLYDRLDGLLGLVVAAQACGDDLRENANTYFEALNQERDRLKSREGEGYLNDLFFAARSEKRWGNAFFENIGQAVPKAKYLLRLDADTSFADDETVQIVYHHGTRQVLLVKSEADARSFLTKHAALIRRATVLRLNNTDFIPDGFPAGTRFGFQLVGNYTPVDRDGDLKDFSQLIEGKKNPRTDKNFYEMMSVMRLDVDDLGCVFNYGMGEKAALTQVAALSREMNYFFAGYFNYLAELHQIYVVYSGGDDAFVVGQWFDMLDFARRLQQDFSQFTGKNPDIHFCAGIFNCDAHYPVAKFAEDAKVLLDDETKRAPDKNKLNVFNHVADWTTFGTMLDLGDRIANYTIGDQKPEKLAKSLVYRILSIVKNSFYEKTHIDEHGQAVKKGTLRPETFYRNIANLKYLFARQGHDAAAMAAAEQKAAGLTSDVIRVILDAFENSRDSTRHAAANNLKIALNYALYQLREPSSK